MSIGKTFCKSINLTSKEKDQTAGNQKLFLAVAAAAAAAAKSLQLCPTLCDPIDGSPPGSRAPRAVR